MPDYQSYNRSKRPTMSQQIPKVRESDGDKRRSDNGRYELASPPKLSRNRKRGNSSHGRHLSSGGRGSNSDFSDVGRRRGRLRKNYVIHFALLGIVFIIVFSALSTTVLFNAQTILVINDGLHSENTQSTVGYSYDSAETTEPIQITEQIGREPHYSDEEIFAAGGIEIGQNLIRFDSTRAGEEIFTTLVQLDNVKVERRFPSTIVVTVENAVRKFIIVHDGEYWCVSQNGRIINVNRTRPHPLESDELLVTGFSSAMPLQIGGVLVPKHDSEYAEYEDWNRQKEKAELLFELSELLTEHDFAVSRIDISDRFDVKMFYGEVVKIDESDYMESDVNLERVEIRLGVPVELSEKIIIASRLIADEIGANEAGVLRVNEPRRATFLPDS
ncbi:MAG: FtsQ-type POTRA domain-containing protein [Oscillospiraceae bacterium]|nr:FtsQ-type POTRA domain-containing protein [Oscillospiraceae bacterium]